MIEIITNLGILTLDILYYENIQASNLNDRNWLVAEIKFIGQNLNFNFIKNLTTWDLQIDMSEVFELESLEESFSLKIKNKKLELNINEIKSNIKINTEINNYKEMTNQFKKLKQEFPVIN